MSRFLIIVAVILTFGAAGAASLSGKIIVVSDGDTVHILTSEKKDIKIRLNKIDAPEHNQDFGQQSKKSLSDMIFGKTVTVQYQKKDRYGRVLGIIYLGGRDINLEQVKRGMAWVYRRYTSDPVYIQAEGQARKNKIGLWSHPDPMNPEQFRHGSKSSRKSSASMSGQQTVNGKWQCGSKTKCSEMQSCDEAKFYLAKCGVASLDGNGDGIPCNALCR